MTASSSALQTPPTGVISRPIRGCGTGNLVLHVQIALGRVLADASSSSTPSPYCHVWSYCCRGYGMDTFINLTLTLACSKGVRELVWFGLVGFSFNASLEPQPRARRRARLAEDAPARHAFWTRRARPNPGTACAA